MRRLGRVPGMNMKRLSTLSVGMLCVLALGAAALVAVQVI